MYATPKQKATAISWSRKNINQRKKVNTLGAIDQQSLVIIGNMI
jgi:hypothetical protein